MSKHLSLANRIAIEQSLNNNDSLRKISNNLSRAGSTISREIKKHAYSSTKGAPHRTTNRCINRRNCKITSICEEKPNCTRKCSTCYSCNSRCPQFVEETCERLSSSPYVCNGCAQLQKCTLRKLFYDAQKADDQYRHLLVDCRQGANVTEEELIQIDKTLFPLILKGQSVHHIMISHGDSFSCCEKTIYRYINSSLLTARNIDMPRVCRIKPRRKNNISMKIDKSCRNGRTMTDYKAFLAQNPDIAITEADSVIGRIGGNALMTMHINSCDLMLAFLRDANTSQSVIDVLEALHARLGNELFCKLFPLILTDNGSEFSNPKALEYTTDGSLRTRIFYCDPYAPYQKPNVELNHEFIRRVLPKGTPFDHLTQSHVDLMMSHVNSYSRPKFNDQSPMQVFTALYGADTLELLNLTLISPDNIVLKPSLLK